MVESKHRYMVKLFLRDPHMITQDFEAFQPRKRTMCWVVQNDIVATLKACFQKFEAKGGRIDWEAFNEIIKEGPFHTSSHYPDISKFYDKKSIREILTYDKELFSLFDFPRQP